MNKQLSNMEEQEWGAKSARAGSPACLQKKKKKKKVMNKQKKQKRKKKHEKKKEKKTRLVVFLFTNSVSPSLL